jgi:hypothetical protein
MKSMQIAHNPKSKPPSSSAWYNLKNTTLTANVITPARMILLRNPIRELQMFFFKGFLIIALSELGFEYFFQNSLFWYFPRLNLIDISFYLLFSGLCFTWGYIDKFFWSKLVFGKRIKIQISELGLKIKKGLLTPSYYLQGQTITFEVTKIDTYMSSEYGNSMRLRALVDNKYSHDIAEIFGIEQAEQLSNGCNNLVIEYLKKSNLDFDPRKSLEN